MKKQGVPILLLITVLFAVFTLGYFLGYSRRSAPVTLSVPDSVQTVPDETTVPNDTEPLDTIPQAEISFPIDINSAGTEELMALPGIGEKLAERIIACREESGGFSRVEDIMNVDGIRKKRFEDIVNLITVGG